MSQVPVKMANTCELWTDTPNGPVYDSDQVNNRMVPVVELSALREVVEGLKLIGSGATVDLKTWLLDHGETHLAAAESRSVLQMMIAQRILASLGEVGK